MALILAIESSCDDTSASVLRGSKVLSNMVATQVIHEKFGGVVPELASREHQKNIIPVVHMALEEAGVKLNELDAIACTKGPGLLGSLLVGVSFAKSLSLSLGIPLIGIHHMKAHILAHFIDNEGPTGLEYPFLCLTVSGGHTQIVRVDNHDKMTILGETIDDAAGEAFDKTAKIMGLPYPGGPEINRLAKLGDSTRFKFPTPKVEGLNFSFSGLKTSILYFLQKEMNRDREFIQNNIQDLCASVQSSIVDILLDKFIQASKETGIISLCLAGGVSANSELREKLMNLESSGYKCYIPKFEYCTDNAAMIGIAAHFKFMDQIFDNQKMVPVSRWPFS